jgi:hypothetical protein
MLLVETLMSDRLKGRGLMKRIPWFSSLRVGRGTKDIIPENLLFSKIHRIEPYRTMAGADTYKGS